MEQWWTAGIEMIQGVDAGPYLRALIKVGLGLLLGRFAGRGLVRLFARDKNAHRAMLLRRVAFYGVLALFCASALSELGFELGILLGAAGILTVAVGFASQTSASNIISGIFLLGERPFEVGDMIKVDDTVGEVLSIDMLSVKLRTLDNQFVRIPNETVIKSKLTNIRHFPIRRLDMDVGVAYHEDMKTVRQVLLDVADRNPLCLEEPAPKVLFTGFEDSALGHEFRVWAKTENFLELRDSISVEIKAAFDEQDIEIPFPHLTLYTGTQTDPFPLRRADSTTESPPEPAESDREDERQPAGRQPDAATELT